MSYDQAKYIPLNKWLKAWVFASWLIDNIEDVDKIPNATSFAQNNRFDWESPCIRPWHQVLSTLTAGSYPKWIGRYYRTVSTNDRLVVRHNTDATHKLYTIETDGTATSIVTGSDIASDNRMRFLNVADVVYCMNGSDVFWKLSNTTYSIPTTLPKALALTSVSGKFTKGETVTGWTSSATGKVLSDGNNPLIIGVLTWTFVVAETITWWTSGKTGVIATISNFTPSFAVPFDWKTVASWRPAVPNTIIYGVADNYEDLVNTGTDVWSTIETITWLASTNQALFYFTTNTISVTDHWDIVNTAGTVSYNSSYLTTKEWSVNHDWIVVVGTKVYYVTPSNTITMIARGENVAGFDTISLSDRKGKGITNFMWSFPQNQTNCRAYLQEDTNLIHWFFYSQGATFPDKIVVYDHVKDIFVSTDTNRYFFWGVSFKGKNYTISAIEPKVFRDEYSYDDQWSLISRYYWTKLHYLWGWTQDAQIRESRTLLDMNTLASPYQEIRLNWSRVDIDQLTSADIAIPSWGIGTEEIGTFAIGTEWSSWLSPSDYQTVRRLRSKWCFFLNKFNTIQWRRSNWTVWGKVRLKDVSPFVSWVPPLRTPQNT